MKLISAECMAQHWTLKPYTTCCQKSDHTCPSLSMMLGEGLSCGFSAKPTFYDSFDGFCSQMLHMPLSQLMLGEGLSCVSARIRKSLETGFIVFRITEPRFDTLRFKDRGYLPTAGIDDRVIAFVTPVTVVVFLGAVIQQVHMAGCVSLCFLHFVHRIQCRFDGLHMQVEHVQ